MDISDKDLIIPISTKGHIRESDFERIKLEYKNLIWEFVNDLNSELTAKTYVSDLRRFFEFTHDNFELPMVTRKGVSFEEITRQMVVAYKKFLQTEGGRSGKPAAPLTVIKKLSSIKSFYAYLLEKNYVSHNPADSVRRPKAEVIRDTQDLTDNEVIDLFELVERTKSPARYLHRAVILTMFCTGIRQGALRKLKIESFKFLDGIYYLEYFDKGSKKHKSVLHEKAVSGIKDYIKWMFAQGREHEKGDPLFQPTRNRTGDGNLKKELAASSVSYIIEHYANIIAKDKRITPHSARATLISSLLEAGKELHQVSKDINHNSPVTTARYDKRRRELKESVILDAGFFIKKERENE
jgi:site-specific recombinase XerD